MAFNSVSITPTDPSTIQGSSSGSSQSLSNLQNVGSSTSPAQYASGLGATAAATTSTGSATSPTASLSNSNASLILRYPLDLPVYFMGFLFAKYQRPLISSPITLTSYKSVGLPVPNSLVDHVHQVYTEQALGAAYGALAEAGARGNATAKNSLHGLMTSLSDISSGGSAYSAAKDIGSSIVAALQNGENAVEGATKAFLQEKSGIAGAAFGQIEGSTVNPYLQVLYVQPAFKRHQFTWKFSPNNPKESLAAKNIIDTFKYAQLPSLGGGSSAFLNYPNIVYPFFSPNAYQMYVFRACVISDVATNYAPNGVPAFMSGTKFAESMELTVSFQEIEIHTKDNFLSQEGYLKVD